jgi:hypothetical protein
MPWRSPRVRATLGTRFSRLARRHAVAHEPEAVPDRSRSDALSEALERSGDVLGMLGDVQTEHAHVISRREGIDPLVALERLRAGYHRASAARDLLTDAAVATPLDPSRVSAALADLGTVLAPFLDCCADAERALDAWLASELDAESAWWRELARAHRGGDTVRESGSAQHVILVIDHDQQIQDGAVEVLRTQGWHAIAAQSVAEARSILDSVEVDAILVGDVPGADRMERIVSLRSVPAALGSAAGCSVLSVVVLTRDERAELAAPLRSVADVRPVARLHAALMTQRV